MYESPGAKAYWDVPVFAEYEHVPQNRVDARFIDHKEKKIIAVEMSCPWVDNRTEKERRRGSMAPSDGNLNNNSQDTA